MANLVIDNVYTTCFTPREYQVELLDAAKRRNIIICLGSAPTKAFISVKLIQELSKDVRHNKKKTVHITNEQNVDAMAACLGYLTDLQVTRCKTLDGDDQIPSVIESAQVIVTTALVFSKLITQQTLNLDLLNLIIIDECHSVVEDKLFLKVMTLYGQTDVANRPRILALTSSLFEAGGSVSTLEAALERLERTLHSTAETASDIVTLLRYSHKPHEMIIECGRPITTDLTELLRNYILSSQEFLVDHRYDPYEMYDDEFQEELQRIPDPKIEPQTIFDEFLYALDVLGPWGADRAALVLLMRTEKSKIRTPYERHFLLLCMASSVLLKIRCLCDDMFEPYTELERVQQFSSPKVLRLIELFHQFKPPVDNKPALKHDDCEVTDNSNPEDDSPCKLDVNTDPNLNDIPYFNLTSLNIPNGRHSPNESDHGIFLDDPNSSFETIPSDSDIPLNTLHADDQNSPIKTIACSPDIPECKNTSSDIPNDPNSPVKTISSSPDIPECKNTSSDIPNDPNSPVKTISSSPDIPVCKSTSSDIPNDPNSPVMTFPSSSYILNGKSTASDVLNDQNSPVKTVASSSDILDGKSTSSDVLNDQHSPVRTISSSPDVLDGKSTSSDVLNDQNSPGRTISSSPDIHDGKSTSSDVLNDQNSPVKTIPDILDGKSTASDVLNDRHSPVRTISSNSDLLDGKSTSSDVLNDQHSPGRTISSSPDILDGKSTASDVLNDQNSNDLPNLPDIFLINDETVSNTPERSLINDDTTVPEGSDNLDKNPETSIDSPYKSCDITTNAMVCDRINNLLNSVYPHFEPRGNRNSRKGARGPRRAPHHANINPDALCGIIFVQERITARILFYLLCELSRHDPALNYISVQYTVDKFGDAADTRELEIEHRNQEEVLKKFRMHECNLLVSTSILEEGIDVPRCNVIVHFDKPKNYRSYVHCKGRARASGAYHVFMIDENNRTEFVEDLAEYYEIENILLRKCGNQEPPPCEEIEADQFVNQVACYRPKNSDTAFVNLCTAIALLNRYCARLPSDTFTRLTPIWNIYPTRPDDVDTEYQCSLRLPINSPLKQTIIGPAMKTRVLARRITALRACRALHEAGELDDNLMPIGKEGFRASEPDWDNFPLDTDDEQLAKDSSELRPGTTKRRQYYTKRIAETLIHCKPIVGTPAYLYHIKMILTCPLPEEQNTRGRKIYPPEDSPQGFGILTLKQIPKICSFPIFTRSGEVNVELELSKTRVVLDEEQLKKICEFLNYMFTSVLRLQKYLMVYDPDASENSYLIVPTYKYQDEDVLVDWKFLDRIYENKNLKPHIVPEDDRKNFKFHASKYQDAVVMPWYRNQDQPQYFYVAEICYQLNPKSTFPGADYNTFEEYYYEKYNIQVQNCKQPLLDVDHTSARLNFLTPRYVNRKGVALPTSSEETKRAKRENLEHKQILVPELCTVHPFPASLWRKAVCLPCILYRINALLLADQIRKQLARDLALGQIDLDKSFQWPQLDFGWSLAAVLKKSNEAKLALMEKKELEVEFEPVLELTIEEIHSENEEEEVAKAVAEKPRRKDWMEIGTWSNEMADNCRMLGELSDEDDEYDDDEFDGRIVAKPGVRYGSPTSMLHTYHSYSDEFDYSDTDESLSFDDNDDDYQTGLLRIEFKGENTAEAIENDLSEDEDNELAKYTGPVSTVVDTWNNEQVHQSTAIDVYLERFRAAVAEHQTLIESSGILIDKSTDILIEKSFSKLNKHDLTPAKDVDENDPNIIEVAPLDAICCEEEALDYCCSTVDFFEDDTNLALKFKFDEQPILENHPGPSPSVILQALTMSNANDGINLERLETIGDSFLKYAITTYLYCTYENVHEGKLSHLRSKQVSNLNLYRLGRRKTFGESMIATKFEPHDNWLPPCYHVPKELEQALIDAKIPAIHWHETGMSGHNITRDEFCKMVRERGVQLASAFSDLPPLQHTLPCVIPYNLLTQQSIPDKSIADCVEALIGAYLIECGPRGALLFMAWLGIRVLPLQEIVHNELAEFTTRPVGSLEPVYRDEDEVYAQTVYGTLKLPKSPLLRYVDNPEMELDRLLDGYETFERAINYKFRDRSYLLQSLTHASYFPNQLTDCYQRLEFLGDAVLDYLITRHLYEDSRQHSPGALTDLRSALVNNTIFASLAVRYGFHKYFRHLSPGLHEIIDRFVRIQENNGHLISEEYYLIEEDECEEAEDVEVPKALGDVFESVAGAIFLDSGMSLDAVWRVYYRMMQAEIELFSTHVPKSPIRELLELEPETAKFGKPEKLADGRRVRVSVEVFGKGTYKGIGRNYRIAKCTAAKCALKQLRLKYGLLVKKN